jgi:hypothetical protein
MKPGRVQSTRRRALILLAGVSAASLVAVPAANAATDGVNTSTVNITPAAVRSITVSPSTGTFGDCNDNNGLFISTLTIPGGFCRLGAVNDEQYVTVTNGPVAGHVYVNGADAVPTSGGSGWTLGENPAADVFTETSIGRVANITHPLSATPTCDPAANPISADDICAAASNGSFDESLEIFAPTGSTATSTQMQVTTTWTAVP